jgi:hypothetical protein
MRCQVVVLIWAMEVEVQEVHLLVTISVGHRPTDGNVCISMWPFVFIQCRAPESERK